MTKRNRHQRRAARKFEVGTVIYTKHVAVTLTTGEVQLYWFEEAAGFSPADGERLLSWIRGEHADGPGVELHGPFKTEAEIDEHERITLVGPEAEVRAA
jgi:hypothetical protein